MQILAIKIYKTMLMKHALHQLSTRDIEKYYSDYLKLYIQYQKENPKRGFDGNKFVNTNCYGFALDIPCPSIFWELYDEVEIDDFWINPGCASVMPYYRNKKTCITNFESDLESLNISSYDSSEDLEPSHGGYKVALLFNKAGSYHFMRQYQNGVWAEKLGYSNTYNNVRKIEQSAYAKHGYSLEKVYELVKPFAK